MIYIVEIPHQGRPRSWFAFDKQDFVLKVKATLNEAACDDFDGCVDALVDALEDCIIFMSETQAILALQREPRLDPDKHFHAHMALRKQLIAMEAMEEDI